MLISTSNWFKLQPKQLVRFLFFDFLALTFALKHLLSAKLAWQKHSALSCPFSRQVHHPLQIVMPKWFIDVFCLLAWFFPPAFWLRVFFLWRGSTHDEKNFLRVNILSPSDCSAYGYRDWSHEILVYNIEHHEWKKSPCTINCTIYYIFICSCSLLAIFISPSTWDHQLQSSDSDSADSALLDFEARPGNDSSLLLDFNFQRFFCTIYVKWLGHINGTCIKWLYDHLSYFDKCFMYYFPYARWFHVKPSKYLNPPWTYILNNWIYLLKFVRTKTLSKSMNGYSQETKRQCTHVSYT